MSQIDNTEANRDRIPGVVPFFFFPGLVLSKLLTLFGNTSQMINNMKKKKKKKIDPNSKSNMILR